MAKKTVQNKEARVEANKAKATEKRKAESYLSSKLEVDSETGIKKQTLVDYITVQKVENSKFQKKGTTTAVLKQEITNIVVYPGNTIENSKQDSLFAAADYDVKPTRFENVETRVAFLNVPKGTTIEDVEARLKELGKRARIYKIVSYLPKDVLTEQQLLSASSDKYETTYDQLANKCVARYPKGSDLEGQIILDENSKVTYRATYFTDKGLEDIDFKVQNPEESYLTKEIEAELSGIATVKEMTEGAAKEADLFGNDEDVL